jgi:hypothetical protein
LHIELGRGIKPRLEFFSLFFKYTTALSFALALSANCNSTISIPLPGWQRQNRFTHGIGFLAGIKTFQCHRLWNSTLPALIDFSNGKRDNHIGIGTDDLIVDGVDIGHEVNIAVILSLLKFIFLAGGGIWDQRNDLAAYFHLYKLEVTFLYEATLTEAAAGVTLLKLCNLASA